jgi:RNA polymerase sigma-70 factor (family 1)
MVLSHNPGKSDLILFVFLFNLNIFYYDCTAMRIKLSFQDIVELQNHVACHRDEPSYKTLFLHFHKPLLELAYSFVRSRETAEELVCDVLMKVWTMKDALLKIKNLKFYLYQSVKNASLNELKKNKKHNGGDLENLAGQSDDSLYNPEELLIKDELIFRISTAINGLPPKCQQVYKLVREEGFSYKEVAELLDISTNTVDRHLNNALHKLMHTVKQYYSMLGLILFYFLQ